uniref:ribonuclease H n=1 Tax=Plectus sambesii TaxID=2011161 RepID=A0A914V1Y2_9BILA
MGNFVATQDAYEQQKESVSSEPHIDENANYIEQHIDENANYIEQHIDENANYIEQHIDENANYIEQQQVNEIVAPYNDPIIIYTDGSYVPSRAVSAVGCFFGFGHPLNFGKPLDIPDDVSEHDNNLAEIVAAEMALEKLLAWPQSEHYTRSVVIRTDSQSVVNSMNRNPFPEHIRFAGRLHQLKELTRMFPLGVAFEHVPGHSNVHGNDEADLLARDALNLGREQRSRSWSGRSRSRSRSRSRGPRRSRSDFVPRRARL